jgi:oxygen-independent coproporphyrinogen-3 oxidase
MLRSAEAGYEHYEVSNFARPGFRSRHNSNYWNHTNYLGLGPSAHSFFMAEEPLDVPAARRWWNIADITKYLERIQSGKLPVVGAETLNERQLLEEAIMLGLRSDGIIWERIERRFGAGIRQASHGFVHQLAAEGLALADDAGFRLTDRGYLVCDEIVKKMLTISRDGIRKEGAVEKRGMPVAQERQMSIPPLTLAGGSAVS